MAISNETKVGILSATAIILLFLGFNFLKGSNLLNQGRVFYAEYENISGLLSSDPVMYKGFRIGRVQESYLENDKVIVVVNITDPLAIPKDSKLQIVSSDLLGSKAVKLIYGKGPSAANKDTLSGITQTDIQQEIRAELEPVIARTQDMIGSIDSAINIINSIVGGGDTEDRFKSGLLSVTATLKSFERISSKVDKLVDAETEVIDSILGNLQTVTGLLNGREEQIGRLVDNITAVSDSLVASDFAGAVNDAQASLENLSVIIDGLAEGNGSLGKLIVEEDLYNNLNKASKDLDSLLLDLQENPGRYVTLLRIGGGGKKNKGKQ